MRSITISALLSFLPIFLFCQSIDWEQRIQDANGSPFFTGGFSFANPCFADIDKDGDADCFVGKQDGTISYFENTGSVTSPHWQFITAQYNDIAFSYMKYGNVTFTDIDDDGDLDMFYGGGRSSNNSGIHFYRNDGNAFQPDWVLVSDQYMNINTNPTAVYNYCKSTFADLDNDGDQDLLFGNYNKDIYYENTGNAQSANFVLADLDYFNFGPLGYWNYHNPALTDIDQDGDFDCFIGTTNSHFLFFENTGTPENAQWNLVSEEYVPIECCENIAPAFYDIDDDSDKDMFVGLTSGKIRFYLDQSRNASPVWEFQNDNPLTLDIGFNSNAAMADIYGNNKPSLFMLETGLDVIGNQSGIIQYINTGTENEPMWEHATDSFFGIRYKQGDWINAVFFADADMDEDLDLFIGLGFDSCIMYHENHGTSSSPDFDTIGEVAVSFNASYCAMFNPVLVDIDSDGDLDMYVSAQETIGGYNPQLWFFRNQGTPQAPDWQLEYQQYAQWGKMTFLDEDGDNDLDVLFSGRIDLFKPADSLILYENQGTPQEPDFVMTNSNYLPLEIDMFAAVTACDADHDGKTDLYFGTNDGGLMFYKNLGYIQGIDSRPDHSEVEVLSCYPVPCRMGSTLHITWENEKRCKVGLSILNHLGQEVIILSEEQQEAGRHVVIWNLKKHSVFNKTGVYFCRLIQNQATRIRKIVVI